MANDDDGMEQELQAVKDDLSSLHRDVKALLSAVGTQKDTEMRDFKDRLADEARFRAEQIRRRLERAARYCGKATEGARRGMSQRPVTSVLIALAAGSVLGRLLGRER
jgi:ElaB/YqjD/DUF883 family membrane-anchored ribosome-binding protein